MDKRIRSRALRCKHVALAVTAVFLPSGQSYALPTGEAVVAGDVTVARPTAQTMQIDQATQKGIVNWLGFSIGAAEHVNITQPNASASLLNRVVGNNPSEIFGRLTANGRVFLVNPNGVLFAPGASVDVGSLFASSLALADQDFLAGRYQFSREGNAGSVINQGTIITANGYTALIGPQVRNDGVIIARAGAVALAAGDRVSLDLIGDGLISVSVDQAALNASVVNTGRIEADGGIVVLAARSANALLDTVINTSGIVRASSLVERNGEIILDGGGSGTVQVAGTVQADGSISMTGGSVDIAGVVSTGTMSIGALSGSISESAGGAILANTLNTNSAGATTLSGPNQISNFSGFSNGALSLTNSGALTVNSFFAMLGDGTLTNAGDVSVTGGWSSQAAKIDTTGNLTVTGSITSNGFMEVDVGGTLTVAASGQLPPPTPGFFNTPRMASLTSLAGQDIKAGGIKVTASDGAFATISNNGAPSTINTPAQKILVGGGGIEVRSAGSVLPPNPQSSAQISNFSTGNQEITVSGGGGINVISTAGNASISNSGPFLPPPPPPGNQTPGSQTITVTAGPGIDLFANGGSATITQNAPGGAQRITATNADHIALDGRAGLASISNFQGEQAISLTGSGNNALRLGSAGGQGLSQMLGSNQVITAGDATLGEAGRIELFGANAPAVFVGIVTSNAPGAGNSQTVSTAGTITIQGGNSAFQNPAPPPANITSSFTGITHNSNGQQTINAASVGLQGGAGLNNGVGISSNQGARQQVAATAIALKGGRSGTNNTAFITSNSGGDQTVIATGGSITITGGDGGTSNRAGIVTNASQTISGNPDIVLWGGVAGNGNNVFIQSTFIESPGGQIKPQTVNARSIEIRAGAGTDASATLNAARQVITTTGDVSLFGGAGLGSTNGVRIGGIGGTTLGPTNLTLTVGGDLLLHAGTANGASLGSSGTSTQANIIAVTAGNITLESEGAGARIGTSGQVPVTPGSITVTAAGDLQLGDGAAIRAIGPITLTANGLVNDGTITNGGGSDNMLLSANSYDLAGGTVQGGSAAVLLRPRDGTRSFGIEAAGDPTLTNHTNLTNADIASISTSNFIVFGSGMGTTFTGNMTIGQDALVNGGAKNLAFFRSAAADGTTTIGANGVSTGGNVIVSAGGGSIVSNGGVVSGNQVQLRAARGIGSAASRVLTSADRLAINNAGTQGVFVTELGPVTLGDVNLRVGTIDNNVSNFAGGAFDLTTQGDLTVSGVVTGGLMTIHADGALNVAASGVQDAIVSSNGGQTITAQSVSVTAHDGRLGQIVNNVSGEQTITTGALSVGGGSALTYPTLSGVVQNAGDAQTINASSIQVQGTDVGTNNGIFIRAALGDQRVNVSGDIAIAAGAGGEAWIQGSRDGLQKIYAHNITMKNAGADDLTSPTGTNSFAALQGGHQEIHASGDVLLKGGRTAGTGGGARMGGLRNALDVSATDLKLYVTGNLALQGGAGADNGVSIGTSGSVALPNSIYIEAGSVALNAGSGTGAAARIGSGSNAVAGGNIEVHAAGGIDINGGTQSAVFRTQGNVWLDAASINQIGNGFVTADKLTVTTTGAANLGGPNLINRFEGTSGGALTLRDAGSLEVLGITTTNAPITLTTDSLINSGVIANGGDPGALVILNANAFNLAGGEVQAGAAAVAVRPRNPINLFGIESAGQTTLSNADIAKIYTDNFIILGSGQGAFTGSMIIGQNARVEGGDKNLAFLGSGPGTITIGNQGVRTGGDLIVSAGPGTIASNGGTVRGDEVQLRATQGIGTSLARVNTDANALTVGTSGSAFVTEANDVTLRTIVLNVNGNTALNTTNISTGGALELTTGGALDVAGAVTSGGAMTFNVGSALNVIGNGTQDAVLRSNTGQTITAQSVNLAAADNRRALIENFGGNQSVTATTGGINLIVSEAAGVAQIANTGIAGSQTITAAGGVNVLGGAVSASVRNSGIFNLNGGGGMQTVTATGLTLQGASSGTSAGAIVSSQGSQLIDVTGGNITLRGGDGGTNNHAQINAGSAGTQNINAHHISLSNGIGGNDVVAVITGGHQTIDVTGTVTLSAERANASGVPGTTGVRIGGPGGGNPTDLKLFVDGDLILNGGSLAGNGVGIGSSSAGVAQANTLLIDVGGSVKLNGGSADGTNARIGSSAQNGLADGTISIKAGSIELNGGSVQPGVENSASIRTLGSVTLTAGTISESGNGLIIADTLTTTTTSGATTLTGPNEVGRYSATSAGDLNLHNTVALEILNLGAPNATVTNAGLMTVSGFWNSTGATSITTIGAGSDLTVSSSVFSSGPMNVNVDGALVVAASGVQAPPPPPTPDLPPFPPAPHFASLVSFGGQEITAKSLRVSADGGGQASISNQGIGTQTITVWGGDLNLSSLGHPDPARPASRAEIGNFGTGVQTITVLGALTVDAKGSQAAPPPPPGFPPFPAPQFASVSSSGGQIITAHSVGVSAEDGAVALISQSTGSPMSTGNQSVGHQTITVSGGGINVRSSGGPILPGSGASSAQISNSSFGDQAITGDQTITVSGGGLNVSSTGGSASIFAGGFDSRGFAKPGGSQTIVVSGGSGVEVQSAGPSSGAFISQNAPGSAQTLTVADADHINVTGWNGNAGIFANGGTQTVSITGSGANAITVGGAGANGSSQLRGGSTQSVTAGVGTERGSITIVGPDRNAVSASIGSRQSPEGTQTIATTGLLSIQGGTAANQNFASGVFHDGSGLQDISAAGLELRGGTTGNGNGVIIGSNGGGILANAGDQRLDIRGDIVVAAGNGGDALINGGQLAGQRQTIYGRNIDLSNGDGGMNSFAGIRAGTQEIHATGHVHLTARSTAGVDGGIRIGSRTPSGADLKLFVGGDLVLTGGDLDNAANIGSGLTAGPVPNHIYIETGGSVILNAGTRSGVRIGSPGDALGGGAIEIHAQGGIHLNGTATQTAAIRSLGSVTLDAATITETGRGFILAGSLDTTTRGDTLLTGPNQVSSFTAASESGNVSLTNTSALLTLGSMDLPGTLSVIQAGDVAVGAANASSATLVMAAGDLSIDASGAIAVRGSDTTAGAASSVISGGTLEFNAGSVSLIGGAALDTPVMVRGDLVEMQLAGRLNVTGGSGQLSPALLSSGSNFNLEIGDSVRVDAGSGLHSLARIQTEIKDGVINIYFPELSAGGYFVNGVEGSAHHGQTGFFTLHMPAMEGRSLLLTYGD